MNSPREFVIVLSLWAAVGIAPSAVARELPDFTQLVERQGQAVVNINASSARGREGGVPGLDENDPMFDFFRRMIPRHPPITPRDRDSERAVGSGFIVSADGYILTNTHVVDRAGEIVVSLADKREFGARLIGADKRTDVAVLKIEAQDLPTVRLGDASRLKVGEWVAAIGSPFGFEQTVTAGIVSAKGRSLPEETLVPFIQTDVAINPGNSGGPLFNLKGEVVGINSQIYSRTGGFMGLSFAIPIDVAMDVQSRLRQDGRVQRGRIGVAIQEVTRELAESFGLAQAEGALVSSVEAASPAERAGVRQGDVILKFDGRGVANSVELPRLVGSVRPGTQVAMAVWRQRNVRELVVQVGEIKEEASSVTAPARWAGKGLATNRFGLVVAEPSGDQRRQLNLESGVVVEQAQGPAARAEMRRGDAILAYVAGGQQTPIRSVAQFNQLIAAQGKARLLTLLVSRGPMPNFVSLRADD
ncbi:MAG: Do family serine endopeptidase [Zoogloeaceae bacterium]|nr:Do family serine endopeptidase [Zoogloeaceae bacterium]